MSAERKNPLSANHAHSCGNIPSVHDERFCGIKLGIVILLWNSFLACSVQCRNAVFQPPIKRKENRMPLSLFSKTTSERILLPMRREQFINYHARQTTYPGSRWGWPQCEGSLCTSVRMERRINTLGERNEASMAWSVELCGAGITIGVFAHPLFLYECMIFYAPLLPFSPSIT